MTLLVHLLQYGFYHLKITDTDATVDRPVMNYQLIDRL